LPCFVICCVRSAVNSYVSTEVEVRYRCSCCGYKTLDAPGALRLCAVCWWEDDGQEDADASEIRLTVNGQLSLNQARTNYSQFGAAHLRFLPYVRKPQAGE
jgi:Cysteine-rich CPCC